ncbi:MAG: hypothetical protein ACKVQR_01720 [Aquabacterium sp.]
MKSVLLCLSMATAATAWADRPLATNNADVHAPGGCVVEVGVERLTESGAPSATGQGAAFACGVGLMTEVGLGYARARSSGVTAKSWGVSGKTSLIDRKDNLPGYSLGWGVDWLSAPGAGTQREGSFLNGIVSAQVAEGLILHANLGWSHSRSARQSSTTWGLAAEKSIGAGLELLGEAFGSDRDTSPWVNIGLRWAVVPDKWFLDAGWAVQTSSTRPKSMTLGLRAEF